MTECAPKIVSAHQAIVKKKFWQTLSMRYTFFSAHSACFAAGWQVFEIFCDGGAHAKNYFSHNECSPKIYSRWLSVRQKLFLSLTLGDRKQNLSKSWGFAEDHWAKLRPTEKHCTLLSYAAFYGATQHSTELRCTLVSYAAPLWATEQRCTFLSYVALF